MAFHVIAGGSERAAEPVVRKISIADLGTVLAHGLRDFWQKPSHYIFLALIYVVVGVVLALWTSGQNTWPLLFPLMSGFALVGPIAAIGLYEISRRLELGLDSSWSHAFEVLRSPALPSIAALGIMLLGIFTLWLTAAQALYESLFGSTAPMSLTAFLGEVLTTERGWMLILWGFVIGFLFALTTLATTVIAFPLLLDRDVGALTAVTTSIRAFLKNPIPILAWGLLVAVLLAIGSIPLFVGLAVVLPVLGHSTWHLYRALIEPQR